MFNLYVYQTGKRPQSSSPIRKNLLSSPLLGRKNKKKQLQESSDDEITASGDEVYNGTNYKDLESFQKAQLRQKVMYYLILYLIVVDGKRLFSYITKL